LRRAIPFEDFVTFDDVEPVGERADAQAAVRR